MFFEKAMALQRKLIYGFAAGLTLLLILSTNQKEKEINKKNLNEEFVKPENEFNLKTDLQNQIVKIKDFYGKIASKEKKVFSQNNEDGVIEAIFDELKLTSANYYVEIGTQSGIK